MTDIRLVEDSLRSTAVPPKPSDVCLPIVPSNFVATTGRGGDQSYVLVGPGQARATPLAGDRFRFEPWIELEAVGSGSLLLKDVCILRVWPVDNSAEVIDAVAAVFVGLIELAILTPEKLAPAIAAMSQLFESGMTSRADRSVEIGLAGELLAILESARPNDLIATWHSRIDDVFDFSSQGERLEVKTTTSNLRTHWFGSEQVAEVPGVCTSVLSICLPLVEDGSTIASMFAASAALPAQSRARLRDVVIRTTGMPPELLSHVVFDRQAAAASLLHVASANIPRPTPSAGVGRMRWEATFGQELAPPTSACRFTELLNR